MKQSKDAVVEEFVFKENDLEGRETLEAIAVANKLNNWFYDTISPRLSGRVLEIGSGIGNIARFFLRDKRQIHLSDIRRSYCAYLHRHLKNNPYLEGISQLDLVHPEFDKEYAHLLNSFDGIFALNVIEHIKNDRYAIANCKKLLRPGGRLVILVPAYRLLYNQLDHSLNHYRRYNMASLSRLLHSNGLRIEHSQYFNFAGIFGWIFSGALLQKKTIPAGQMKMYNSLVPLFKLVDKAISNRAGLSVIVEGIKTE